MDGIGNDRPTALLLDWDGTLVNSLQGIFDAHNHVRVIMGFPAWTWDEYKGHMRSSSRELYPKLYADRSEEAITVLYEYYGTHHLLGLEVLPHAEELLRRAQALGVPMAVVSNKRHDMLLREIDHLGWGHYFNGAVAGAGLAAKDKPAPDAVHHVLAHMNITPGAGMWYAGDTITDMQLAQAVGCRAVLLLNGEGKEDLISEFSPYLVVEGCAALADALSCEIPKNKAIK